MGSEHKDFKGDVDVPESAVEVIDRAVIAKFPAGTRAISISPFGASFWTRTARIETEQAGESKAYFLKTSYGEKGRLMMSGEFTSMSAIFAATPGFCPRPVAWGSYESIRDVHFYLADFHEMTDELPDVHTFTAKLADLHRLGTSPNGKFGFPCTTFHGNTPLEHGWTDTWEEYFTSRTKVIVQMEQKAQGANQEILDLAVPFFEKVVPRLLRPLEIGDRRIKPSLIHGDLWYGNATMDADTEMPLVFDAASFYAHNEYDLGVWRAPWNKIGRPYISRYYKHFPVAPPEEDCDDRNLLYSTRVNFLDSILYKGYSGYREKLIENMRKLVQKYPDGYEGWVSRQQPSIVEVSGDITAEQAKAFPSKRTTITATSRQGSAANAASQDSLPKRSLDHGIDCASDHEILQQNMVLLDLDTQATPEGIDLAAMTSDPCAYPAEIAL